MFPGQLSGVAQFHAFAGIGVWSYALRCSGWPLHVPVWTGSCPCQPWSTAGRRKGADDERHLWPAWRDLIADCRPPIVLGEQVASPGSRAWLDLVFDDLEALGYTCRAIVASASNVGAPHRRDRIYFVAVADLQWQPRSPMPEARGRREAGGLADADDAGRRRAQCAGEAKLPGTEPEQPGRSGSTRELGDAHGEPGSRDARAVSRTQAKDEGERNADRDLPDGARPAGATRGFWADAEWIYCRDEKWRAVEPGIEPLAHGTSSRLGRLRAYGNALCAETAIAFVATVMDCLGIEPELTPRAARGDSGAR